MFVALKVELCCIAAWVGDLPENPSAFLAVSSDEAFIPIDDELSKACKQFLHRESCRFQLAEIQLVLSTDPRFSANQYTSMLREIHSHLIDMLKNIGVPSSSKTAFAQLVILLDWKGNFGLLETQDAK
ncbi:uncharacterized protein N7483_011516 [Penicillium malachiteum]|uniref:uncharacterized protein n=1 Tax=Penicillium malachiteum TaxID=1324776 RepID=UPI0025487901|nr:uncharacterized protein N7483_011516 [Penicillium malachiteum]KAJ5714335.1 hypothetical protein N7483_011516 [Penicillium malachiteum]